MLYQTDPALGPYINEFGCLFCDILKKVEKRTRPDKPFGADEILAIYKSGMQTGIIGQEQADADGNPASGCYINDLNALLRLAGAGNAQFQINPGSSDIFWPVGSQPDSNEEIIERWHNDRTGFTHFVCGAPDGSVEWDPIEGGSVTVREGSPNAYNLIQFV